MRPSQELEAEEAWRREKAEMAEYYERRALFAAQERAAAEDAVAKALTTYRWWGWTNIVNTIRIAIQCWRQRRAAKH